MSIEDKVIKIIVEKLKIDIEEVTLKSSFINDLGADSLTLIELMMSMEDEFDIEISDEDAERLIYVEDAIKYIQELS